MGVWFTDTFGSAGMPESDRERRGHRIRASQKKSDEAVLIQQIQLLALKHRKDRARGPDSGIAFTEFGYGLPLDRQTVTSLGLGRSLENIIHLAFRRPVNNSVNTV